MTDTDVEIDYTLPQNFKVEEYIDHKKNPNGEWVVYCKWKCYPDPRDYTWEPLRKEAKRNNQQANDYCLKHRIPWSMQFENQG